MCCRGRPGLLRQALDALVDAVGPHDEILVVDSAPRDDAVSRVARSAGVAVHRSDRPGLAIARNVGWRATGAELVAFTDDDCRPGAGWTVGLRAGFDAPDVGFVTGRVTSARAGPAVSVLDVDHAATFTRGDERTVVGHGANMAFRRATLADLGGFDELLGVGTQLGAGEDTDAFRRALLAGWTGRYVPAAVVVHEQWRSRWQVLGTEFRYGIAEGALDVKDRAEGRRDRPRPPGRALRRAIDDLRSGYEFGVAVNLVRAAGTVVGGRRASRLEVVDGRFVA